jgi:hypothetical protein
VTWDDVGYYKSHTDKSDAFQLQLVGKGNGNFDIVFRYQNISWTTGDASNGSGGLGGTPAREGYSAGDGTHYYELPGSGTQGSDLALATSTGNAGQAGVWTFPVMNGNVVPVVSIKETAGSIVNLNQGHTAIFDVEVDGNLSHADWQAIPGGTLVVTLKPNVHLLDTRVEAAPVVGPPEPVFAVDTQYGSDWSLPATQITFNEADFHNGSAVKTVSADVYDNPAGADPATSFFTVG